MSVPPVVERDSAGWTAIAQPQAGEAREYRFAARQRGIVRVWLWSVAALILLMVVVGGATRLTESGLSIVEWHPVTGIVPPLSQADWQTEFAKYQEIPQYRVLNRDMSLAEFKSIFWWEWAHRLLGRVIGVAFLLPFIWFLWRGYVEPAFRARLWGIFALGALQGAVGWWMVASGLADRIEVSQYRLATHLTLACLIIVAIVWTAERIAGRTTRPIGEVPRRIRLSALGLLVLVLVQIYLGALVAGLRAGLVYNTWPLIDGAFVPDAARLFFNTPWWRNLFENTLTVQFDHRMVAYTLWALAVLHAIDVARTTRGPALTGALALAGVVTLQAALGIVTLLYVVPLPLGLLHQATAMIVLVIAVVHAAQATAAPVGAPAPLRNPQFGFDPASQ